MFLLVQFKKITIIDTFTESTTPTYIPTTTVPTGTPVTYMPTGTPVTYIPTGTPVTSSKGFFIYFFKEYFKTKVIL